MREGSGLSGGGGTRTETSGEGHRNASADAGLYVEALHRWVERAKERAGRVDLNALAEELETYLKEIQVTQEEIQVQADELKAALMEAEAQRQRYRDLFENAPLPYLTTDVAGGILDVNRRAGELLGVAPDQIIGKPLPLYLSGESELRSRISRLASGRPVQPWETDVRPRAGSPVAAEITARRVDREGDAVIQWILQDIRPRREARKQEKELHREQAARAALEQVARRARFLSRASGRLMGVLHPAEVWEVAAELAGEYAVIAVLVEVESGPPPSVCVRGIGGDRERRRSFEPLLNKLVPLEGGAAGDLPIQAIRMALEIGEPEVVPASQNASDSTGACLVVPMQSGDRTLGAMAVWLHPRARIGEELLVSRNLADRFALALESAAMFEEVVRSRRQAEEATGAEADFLAIVSHELRTPLTAIVSYAELLEERADELPDKLSRYAHQIAAAADHQRQLVEQILTYKRIQREGDQLEHEELDYRKVVRSAAAMVRPQVEGDDVEVEEVVPSVPVHGSSDRGKLQQILTNLLSNAVRHTRAGHVRIRLETQHQWVVFQVEDTGEGMSEEELPRIFDRFWRGPDRDSRGGGSGLGLTITRELVQRLHGEIEVESQRGKGTTFTVRVPRVAPGSRDRDRPMEGGG